MSLNQKWYNLKINFDGKCIYDIYCSSYVRDLLDEYPSSWSYHEDFLAKKLRKANGTLTLPLLLLSYTLFLRLLCCISYFF